MCRENEMLGNEAREWEAGKKSNNTTSNLGLWTNVKSNKETKAKRPLPCVCLRMHYCAFYECTWYWIRVFVAHISPTVNIQISPCHVQHHCLERQEQPSRTSELIWSGTSQLPESSWRICEMTYHRSPLGKGDSSLFNWIRKYSDRKTEPTKE